MPAYIYIYIYIQYTPYTQYPFFLGYHVDPLLKKEVFTLKNQVFPKIPLKKWVVGVGGIYLYLGALRFSIPDELK